jgi:hypothetical protein
MIFLGFGTQLKTIVACNLDLASLVMLFSRENVVVAFLTRPSFQSWFVCFVCWALVSICGTIALDPTFGSFWPLLKPTSFTLREPVSLMKVFRLFRLGEEVGLRAQNAIWNFRVSCGIISNTFKVKIFKFKFNFGCLSFFHSTWIILS